MSKLIMVDGSPIKFQIWDTAGQEKYHSLAPMYYRGAAAAIVVYDITRASSLDTLKAWVRELQQLGPENIVIAICGNKCDLEDRRVGQTVSPLSLGASSSWMYCCRRRRRLVDCCLIAAQSLCFYPGHERSLHMSVCAPPTHCVVTAGG